MGSGKLLSQDTTQLHNRTADYADTGPTRSLVGR
jgi:hypothetical protein